MKKISMIFLTMLTFALSAETRILCTTQPMMILTKAVIRRVPGIKVEQMIASSAGCPHDYALTPGDMKKLATADVIIMNGLGMESFLEKARPHLKSGVLLIDSSKGVKGVLDTLEEDHEHGKHCDKKHKHDHHCEHGKNEHLFAGPSTAAQVVEVIGERLAARDVKNTAIYLANASAYASALKKIAGDYEAFGRKIPEGKRDIAVQHGIFDYAAANAGLKVRVYLQKHTGVEPSAAEIRQLISKLQKEKVALIIAEKGYPDKITKLISGAVKIPVVTLDQSVETESVLCKMTHQLCPNCAHSVSFEHVFVVQDEVHILDDINASIPRGECTAIVGPNGAGKTTMVLVLLNEVSYKGNVCFHGYAGVRPRVGYVPQSLSFDRGMPLTVLEFMASYHQKITLCLGIGKKLRDKLARIESICKE